VQDRVRPHMAGESWALVDCWRERDRAVDRDTAAARSCSGESAVWVAWVGPASTAWVRRPSAVSYRTSARAITHYCYNPLSIRHGAMPYSGAPEPARSHRAGRRPARSQHAWAPPGHRMLRTPELPVQHWAHDSCSDSAGRLAGRCMAAWLHGCMAASLRDVLCRPGLEDGLEDAGHGLD